MKQALKFILSQYKLEIGALALVAIILTGVTGFANMSTEQINKNNQATAIKPPISAADQLKARQWALEAWQKDKLLPGKDMKYNWVEIGGCISDWQRYFREHAISVNDEAFDAAYSEIAERFEKHLKEQAFENSQQ